MKASIIKSKYCKDGKVQVMFSNAPKQIICSKEGFLFIENEDIYLHKYLNDPLRDKMPFNSNPISSRHVTHLFNYDQIYVRFTSCRALQHILNNSFTLSFLYFQEKKDGEAILTELFLHDFEKGQEFSEIMTAKQVIDFLYGKSECDGNYIFDILYGIKYAKSKHEPITIEDKFIDLSDEGIIDLYNTKTKPSKSVLNTLSVHDDIWKTKRINDVQEFTITQHGLHTDYYPCVICISDDDIFVYEFKIEFIKPNSFRVTYHEITITKEKIKDLLLYNYPNLEYPPEPDFDE